MYVKLREEAQQAGILAADEAFMKATLVLTFVNEAVLGAWTLCSREKLQVAAARPVSLHRKAAATVLTVGVRLKGRSIFPCRWGIGVIYWRPLAGSDGIVVIFKDERAKRDIQMNSNLSKNSAMKSNCRFTDY